MRIHYLVLSCASIVGLFSYVKQRLVLVRDHKAYYCYHVVNIKYHLIIFFAFTFMF